MFCHVEQEYVYEIDVMGKPDNEPDDDEDEALAIKTKFETNAEKVFLDAQKWVLKKLKDSGNSSSGGVNSGDSSSGGANGSSSSGSTKKELAMLPSFDGEEKKNPYLQFPEWKRNGKS